VNEWIRDLSRFDKPVVLYDNSNSNQTITRQSVGNIDSYYRCCFDESSAIELAVKTLRELGHRRIGTLYIRGKVEWMQRRLLLLEQTARTIDPELILIRSCLEDEFGVYDDDRNGQSRRIDLRDFDSFIARLIDQPLSADLPVSRLLWEKTRSLRELLELHATTAWIALNDFFQR
jgi:hypothetical protein